MMIEVLQIDSGLYRWFLISEQGRILVIGCDHPSDLLANNRAKEYRKIFKLVAKEVDSYEELV
jgi:uracil-DNA glycosylase